MTCIGLAALVLTSAGACANKDETRSGQPPPSSGAATGDTAPAPAPEAPAPSSPAPSPAPIPAPGTPAVERSLTPLAANPKDHQGTPRWSRAIGGLATELARDVVIDAGGRVAVAGYFEGAVDFGGGAKVEARKIDAFVSTFAADGAPGWTVHFGGDGEDVAHAVAFDPAGNLVIAGLFSGTMTIGTIQLEAKGSDDAFIAKLDAQGKPLWARAIGGTDSDAAHDLALDADGSIYVTGSFKGKLPVNEQTTLQSKGNEDVLLLALGPDGDVRWSQQFGNRYRDFGQRVAVDGAGHVIVLAEFTDDVSFGGEPLVSEGNRDLALAKLTSRGEHVWSRRFGSPFNEYGLGLAVDPAGNIGLTGSFDNEIDFGGGKLVSAGESDLFVTRLAPDGAHLWSKRFGATREDIGHGIAADRFGNLAVTGWFWGEVDFGGGPVRAEGMNKDGFLLKLSADGKHLWSRRFGAKDHDQGRGVAMSPEGEVAAIGIFRFRLDLGGKPLEAVHAAADKAPPPDVFVAFFGR
jgi:hypothetical protein